MSEFTGIKGLSFKAAYFLGQKVVEVKNSAPRSIQSASNADETVDFLKTLSWRPELLSRIQQFAHRPQSWIHPSRLNYGERADLSTRLQRKTAERLDQAFGLATLEYELFANDPWRFALLPLELLEELSRQVGLFNLATSMGSVTSGEQRASIVEQIGKRDCETTMNLAPVMLGVGFEPTAKIPKEWMNDIEKSASHIGWFTIGSVFSNAPKSIVKRFELKLAQEAAEVVKAGRKKAMVAPEKVADFMIRVLKNNIDRKEAICIF